MLVLRWEKWLERYAWQILGIFTTLYALIFAAAALYKFHAFWMGFDLGVHEQVLWNTIHGHLAEVSPFGNTQSYFGIDIILVELLFAPFYALIPRTETMLFLQVVLASTGAIPLFLLLRERAKSATYGLLGALLYFASLPIQYAILYEFQIRVLGTVFFLWAFLFFERKQFKLFLLLGILAIWTRSEGGFTLAAIGFYGLIQRRRWYWIVTPILFGLGWVLLCVKGLIPLFRTDKGFLYTLIYAWLGNTPFEILQTFVTRPTYIIAHVLTLEKALYLLELLVPLLFMPLLRSDIALIALPSLLLNLFSLDRMHWSIRYHYQAFVIPFLLIATLYALIDLRERDRKNPKNLAALLFLMLLLANLSSQLIIRSPLIHLATRPRDSQRIAFAQSLVNSIPPDAALSVTSSLGSHLARRRELYFFPGNVIYPPAKAEKGTYLLADLHEVADDLALLRQIQTSKNWQTLTEKQDFVLLKRLSP